MNCVEHTKKISGDFYHKFELLNLALKRLKDFIAQLPLRTKFWLKLMESIRLIDGDRSWHRCIPKNLRTDSDSPDSNVRFAGVVLWPGPGHNSKSFRLPMWQAAPNPTKKWTAQIRVAGKLHVIIVGWSTIPELFVIH